MGRETQTGITGLMLAVSFLDRVQNPRVQKALFEDITCRLGEAFPHFTRQKLETIAAGIAQGPIYRPTLDFDA